MELLMILYTEELLGKVYKIYQLHQAKHNLPFMQLEDYRAVFEKQQEAILEQISLESDGIA